VKRDEVRGYDQQRLTRGD